MKLIVVNSGRWKPSIDGRGRNKRVTFKPMEPTPEEVGKYFYLNITDYEFDTNAHQSIQEKWEPNCKKGNVLEVSVPQGASNVNKWGSFNILRKVA